MTCTPIKACERRILEPFVERLNSLENTSFVHKKCLYGDRQFPQPEELFVDKNSGQALVIERKSISWPEDYERGHAGDHLVANRIWEALDDLDLDRLYVLKLPYLIKGSKTQLREFARHVASCIRDSISSVSGERAIGSKEEGRSWIFYEQRPWEWEEDQPDSGIIVNWDSLIEMTHLEPNDLPLELIARLDKINEACHKKFLTWPEAIKILLLDPFGALRYHDVPWWTRVLEAKPLHECVDQVWIGMYDWVDDWTQEWIFERIR